MGFLRRNTPTDSETLFRYSGRSMWPCFQEGDVLIVRRVRPEKLRTGDCVVFHPIGAEQPTAHRIVSTVNAIRTQGDARPVEDDEPVEPEQILGKVSARIRFGHASRVQGGRLGVVARRFYAFAGRLDPSREGRGGRLARLVRRLAAPLAAPLVRTERAGSDSANEEMSTVSLGGRVVGAYNGKGQAWTIAWPFCLAIDTGSLPAP